jgi:hypothetical protein
VKIEEIKGNEMIRKKLLIRKFRERFCEIKEEKNENTYIRFNYNNEEPEHREQNVYTFFRY